uniref:Uncharacterized protein n=2 Tax=unclassified Caudoviricetes TaxID=2788787 RepID=A0A8S5NYI9_9CAUD|nr:MAG TPA: hypothetical protein [Siphoviridae sp. ctNU74]DAE09223.1 MAG TPA: hypothetical protein [Siphoviridae sp. ctkJH11]
MLKFLLKSTHTHIHTSLFLCSSFKRELHRRRGEK